MAVETNQQRADDFVKFRNFMRTLRELASTHKQVSIHVRMTYYYYAKQKQPVAVKKGAAK